MARLRAILLGHEVVWHGSGAISKRIETTFWDLHRFDSDGLIIETWNLMDSISVMQQLGQQSGNS